jgi:hypothetical protein
MTKKTQEWKLNVNKYFDFIRCNPCHFGGIVCDLPQYPKYCSQGWDEQKGCYRSEVSHILKRRSIRLENQEHFGNVMPKCRTHHAWWELLPPEIRETYLPIGELYLRLYHEKLA